MRSVILASGLAVGMGLAMMHPAAAQNRDSDGEVISVLPQKFYYRDSDGEVISVIEYVTYYRDSDGNVIAGIPIERWQYFAMEDEYVLDTGDGKVIQVAAGTGSDGQADLPQDVIIDGLVYQVIASGGELVLRADSRINPVAFELE